jgi:predicted DNA-binding transcriptional regulator AlpA
MTNRIGPQDSGPARPTAIPPALEEVALVNASQIAAAAGQSLSWWYEEVSEGRAPKPVIRGPRCTRWRLSDIREWLIERAERGSDPAKAERVMSKARTATAKALERRAERAANKAKE